MLCYGKGRARDNVFVERLWETVKREEVYLKEYRNPLEARVNLGEFFIRCNNERPYYGLNYMTPSEVYTGQGEGKLVNY
ncbi:MAG: hypothetical protein STSR0007_03960 [Thermovirga sp.]